MAAFTDRVVVVTGAYGSLGVAVAQAFADLGGTVALLGRAATPPAALQKQFGSPHLLVGNVELTDLASATHAIDSVRQQLGRIDVLVNVAGGFHWEKIEHGDLDTWERMYSMNLKTTLIASRAALPHLLASAPASIVNVGAGTATKPATAGMGAYAASKAAVQKLTESLADELKDRGVTVNAVLPGTIDTPQNHADMPDADVSRWVPASAIADVITFLASYRASAVTGAAIPVFGRG
ncbi:MAG TPA: SDR family NAD(P)-dependent oxidoreductase [Steroidobacteraceae bacterium]|jgi:NAD(P)-dependent dehydrogenase (short-subunit alcohol dehydrogenase family)